MPLLLTSERKVMKSLEKSEEVDTESLSRYIDSYFRLVHWINKTNFLRSK